eukprot:TRINITY_DN93988_c0_g1_i1.p1 TRINITY_DN93988_c0_g1~~TRINITY_DN93988_c0_g1_i1.p1  ORF type:complete len:258 (-),score=52.77 TRINITY_DN93988_c0_g1_i1:43-816(-)
MGDHRLLVRVKRRRDEEPLPEIILEGPRTRTKHFRPDASAAALRLVDSIGSRQWPDEESSLPASWFRAAADASWLPSGIKPYSSLQAESASESAAAAGSFWHQLHSRPELYETSRRSVEGSAGEMVQLIDVERPMPEASQQHRPLTGFTIDGMELLATPCSVAPTRLPGQSAGDFVWDVYAVSDSPAMFASSASLQLGDCPSLEDDDALEDLDDIDDSSDAGCDSDDAWRGCSSSDGEDVHRQEDRSQLAAWVDVLD